MLRRYLPLALLVALYAPALAQDAPAVDAQTLLRALKQIQERNTEATKSQLNKVIQDFRAAASSNSKAIAFYEEAIRATQFAGQTLQQTQFQEWKKKEAEKLRSNEMQTAARLHLVYATLTLDHAKGVPVSDLLPALFQYTNQIIEVREDANRRELFDKQELLKGKVTDSIFIRWYGAGKLLADLKNWEPSPGNVDGIYQKTILPQMRKNKDARIIQYWDGRITRESKRVSEGKVAFNIEQFNLVQKPTLLWQRAEDLLAIGQRNRAINEMFSIIKNFPDHPDTPTRIASLEKTLTPEPAPATAQAPTTASAPASEPQQ